MRRRGRNCLPNWRLSTPLAKVRLKVNRKAWSTFPGEVFKLTWPQHGLAEVIFRVLKIDFGTLTDGAITIEAAEDVFGLPASSYVAQEPSGWEEPDTAPVPIARQGVVEIPYWTLVRELSAADMAYVDQDAAFFAALAARPNPLSLAFDIYSKVGATPYDQTSSGNFVPAAELESASSQEYSKLIGQARQQGSRERTLQHKQHRFPRFCTQVSGPTDRHNGC